MTWRQVTNLCTIALGASSLTGCGAPEVQVQRYAEYPEGAVRTNGVLFLPIAVSDELGDKRTGIVLANETRAQASGEACKRLSEQWDGGKVVCFDRISLAKSPALGELQQRFAQNQAIPPTVWAALRRASNADYALLFRPESVSSSQEVSRTVSEPASDAVMAGIFHGALAAAVVASRPREVSTENSTEVTYTLSASLVDMRSGDLIAVGVHSDGDSHDAKRHLGYAEPPPVAPILERIMVDLSEDILEQ